MSSDTGISAAEQLEFLGKLQRVLNEGLFVASYKYALIMSIAELCVEKSEADDGTLHLPLRDIAERFIALYWRQALPFRRGIYIDHSYGTQPAAISRIREMQAQTSALSAARRHAGWQRLVNRVARVIKGMPLMRLQRVGKERLTFLYEERISENDRGQSGIVLRSRVAENFRKQFSVIQALVQVAWLSFIQRVPANRQALGTRDLSEFLFGADRAALTRLVPGLTELQRGRCFYCQRQIRDRPAVDHFISWSRYQLDFGHNFVVAHHTCNHDKRDMLAGPAHLARWWERNVNDGETLQQIFEEARFLYDLDASQSVAEWQYDTAQRSGALVWLAKRGQVSKLPVDWRSYINP